MIFKRKALSRLFAVLPYFFLCVLVIPVRAFASSSVTEIDTTGEIVDEKIIPSAPASSLTDRQASAIVDAALHEYFPQLVGYEKKCATATLSAALKLYKEKNNGDINGLQYFLKSVALSARSLTSATGAFNYLSWRSAGNVLMSVNPDLVEEGILDTGIDWNAFTRDTALTAVERFIDPSSGEEKETNRAPTSEDVTISSDVFKEYITDTGNQFSPKNATGKMSYRTDSRWHNKYPNDTGYRFMSVYDTFTQFTAVGGDEMYFVFFYKTAEDTYYSATQYHFTMTKNEEWYEDRDEVSGYNYTLTAEWWDMVDGLSTNRSELVFYNYSGNFVDVNTRKIENVAYNCFDMRNYGSYFSLIGKSKYSDYINYIDGSLADSYYPYRFLQPSKIMYRSDMTTTIDFTDRLFSTFDGSDGVSDIGYIASTTPIETIYRIDTSKIPDNYYVTINGDTVYDYSITNPETGQSDTINNYVTNNYTYITNNGGNGSGGNSGGNGGSGSIGGNITVDGKVDVGGSVGVDINVNVPDININVNSGNVGGNGGSYDLPDTDIFNSYYDEALDESSGFRRFLSDFFSFLPVEVTVLLGIGLTLVIIARILGR